MPTGSTRSASPARAVRPSPAMEQVKRSRSSRRGSIPTIEADLHTFDQFFGIPDPPSFQVVNQGGVTTPDRGTVGETSLDVEWAHAAAPGASIVVYDAAYEPNNPTTSLLNLFQAMQQASQLPGVSVVTLSYAIGEEDLAAARASQQQLDADFTTPGVLSWPRRVTMESMPVTRGRSRWSIRRHRPMSWLSGARRSHWTQPATTREPVLRAKWAGVMGGTVEATEGAAEARAQSSLSPRGRPAWFRRRRSQRRPGRPRLAL